jgi:hypothetical protein
VELGEIEALLAQQPASARSPSCCARTTASTSWSPTSCRKARALDPRELRTALAAKLPPYMVPGRYEMLDAMPRLTSGKIDRKALKARPERRPAGSAEDPDLPETPAEAALFAALATLFPGQPILRNADFFSDLGGHSFFAAAGVLAARRSALRPHDGARHLPAAPDRQNRPGWPTRPTPAPKNRTGRRHRR